MEGRVYTQRSDYERYIKLKNAKDEVKDELVERIRLLARNHVYTANSIAASEYYDTIQQAFPRGVNANMSLYGSEEDDD